MYEARIINRVVEQQSYYTLYLLFRVRVQRENLADIITQQYPAVLYEC